MKTTTLLHLSTASLIALGSAFAQNQAAADTNDDQRISQEEFLATERAQQNPERAQQMFDRLDANDDGHIDKADRETRGDQARANRQQRANEIFDRIDSDSDGTISREEFLAHQPLRQQQGHGGRGAERAEGGERARRGAGNRAERRQRMAEVDTNNDGAISQDEFLATERAQQNPERAQQMFDRLDANDDGQLNQEDREAMREQRQDRRGQRGQRAPGGQGAQGGQGNN